jgi:hypothetical protein
MQYNWQKESIRIDSVTIFRSADSAKIFLEKVYPHWPETIIVSADGEFPQDIKLKNLVIDRLGKNENLPIIVFGRAALENLEIVSKKKLIMDEFLDKAMYKFDKSEKVFDWNEYNIAMFCFLWVSQNKDLRINYADMRETYNPESINWYNNLIY